MSNPENFVSDTIICRGGLDSNQNWLYLSQVNPGIATQLINFEPGLFGGYRRIDGFAALEDSPNSEVDSVGAEGKILGVFVANDTIIAARKQKSGNTYNFYEWNPGGAWTAYTTGLTLNHNPAGSAVERMYYHDFNFTGTNEIIFVDGVNNASVYDGTNWVNIDPFGSGADFANSGGDQALAAPKFCHVWQNHVWMADGDLIAHSAPSTTYSAFDWKVSNGAGRLNAGFEIVQIYPFRDKMFVFGRDRIKYIYVTSDGTFAIQDVTSGIGCVAGDSVMEVGGDLVFLAPDGVRPIAATERIGDVELASISKSVHEDLRILARNYLDKDIVGVRIRGKSQFRLFFTDDSRTEADTEGIISAQKQYPEGVFWEFGKLLGIKPSCADSGYITDAATAKAVEYVVHGGFDGIVYRQEFGNSFAGSNILAVYSTPYMDFGYPSLRKTPYKIMYFVRPEGPVTLSINLDYDWQDSDAINPDSYEVSTTGAASIYGFVEYGEGTYGGTTEPRLLSNVQGSGQSVRYTTTTNDQSASYSIQSIVSEYKIHGYK